MVWRRREHDEPATTEGSLRALLNKLAPSESLVSLAHQVAGYLREADDAPDELARQLIERAQLEPLFAATYAKLCVLLVRARSGFVFYRHLMTRSRAAFGQAVRSLILQQPQDEPQQAASAANSLAALAGHSPILLCQQQLLALDNAAAAHNSARLGSRSSCANGCAPSSADVQRHRLRALVAFLCQLFAEELVSFDALHADFIGQLEALLPNKVAVECLCAALFSSGRALELQRPRWVAALLRQLQSPATLRALTAELRLLFMVQDVMDLQQRAWQPRVETPMISNAAALARAHRDHPEP